MIKKILMKNCATFDNINGVSVDNCKKINFIYGPNGSGKTTIGNYLSDLGVADFSSCSIDYDNTYQILVYNKAFREKQLKNNEMPGVFTLGSATIEKLKEIEELKSNLSALKKEYDILKKTLDDKGNEKDDLRTQFDNDVWNRIYKKYETLVPKVFQGYNNSKRKFAQNLFSIYNAGNLKSHELQSLIVRYSEIYESNYSEAVKLFPIPNETELENLKGIENDTIWAKVIIGEQDVPISKLIKELDNADWVSLGSKYIKDDICPFCQNRTITDEFKLQLEGFFGVEYKSNILRLKDIQQQYNNLLVKFKQWFELIENESKSLPIGRLDLEKYKSFKENLMSMWQNNLQLIEKKMLEPSRKINLNTSLDKVNNILGLVKEANGNITAYNYTMKNIKSEKPKLNTAFWEFFILEQEELIKKYKTEINNISKAEQSLKYKLGELSDRIGLANAKLIFENQNVTSVQPTIDKINLLLNTYGFDGFTIVPSTENKNCYMIQRKDGSLVRLTLSEGEETFITFLYFIQLCEGAINSEDLNKYKIIVLDDPISSLDSTVLFIVSTIIKDLKDKVIHDNSDVKQLFVMTHNIYFHKEITYNCQKYKDNAHFWILRKINNVSNLKDYGEVNPIKTTYQLLWDQVKDDTISSCVVVKNCMRRILENYFSFIGSDWEKGLIDKFDNNEEKIVVKSLLSWVDEGSHDISDDLNIDGLYEDIDLYKKVFRLMFVQAGHEEHYKMMIGEIS